jgi:hypothetical protein
VTRVVGLTGYARSGKNTVASLIAKLSPERTKEVAFADAIKVSAARALGVRFDGDQVGTAAVREWADRFKASQTIEIVESGETIHRVSGREFLQRYGTEAHRDMFDADFWVKVVDMDPPEVDLLLITDVRFPNEAEAIRTTGGEVWKVVRTDGSPANDHPSERPLPDDLIDRTVNNEGTLDDLEDEVERVMWYAHRYHP